MDTLINSLPKLADVGLLILFMVAIFGVLGLQLFQGALLSRCYTLGTDLPISADAVCSSGGVEDGRGTCAAGQVCRVFGHNPANGTVGYDHIGMALMTTFQVRAARDHAARAATA